MRCVRPPLAVLGTAALLVLSVSILAPRDVRAADPVVPDFEFYVANVAPIVEEVCATCHANPRKRLGKHFVKPQPGRTVRTSHHRDNYETLLTLLEPGNPAGSLWLLKALGPGQGGVTHKGGVQVRLGSREYGAMVDFINGAKVSQQAFAPPRSVEGQPDFAFFVARIAPTLAQVCAECHAAPGQGKFSLAVAGRGTPLRLEQHYANFQTVLTLLTLRQPQRSPFLLKPLAVVDGGVAHKGGDRIRRGDPNHQNWLAFMAGERGPDLAREGRADRVPLLETTLTIEAESMERAGSLTEHFDPVTPEQKWLAAAGSGGRLGQTVRVPEAGDFEVSLVVRGGPGLLLLGLDDAPPFEVDVPTPPGFGEARDRVAASVGPRVLLDGRRPLRAVRGDVTATERGLHLDGRAGEARFLSPAERDHRSVELLLELPSEEDGGDDAWLLFDMVDGENGKLAGLVDGGRRFAMGVLEGGQARLLSTAKTFPVEAGVSVRTLRVDFLEGVAIGRLDGHPLAFLHLDRHLGQGGMGALTHGVLEVHGLTALEQFPVHTAAFDEGPILRLSAGVHTLWVELPPGGPSLDRLSLTLTDSD